jgi:hypothetical protein
MRVKAGQVDSKVSLRNTKSAVSVDLNGGAITVFRLLNKEVNPLNFRFSQEQMPANNRGDFPFQGHFLCLGRWGEPTAGEVRAGVPNHGQFTNILWTSANSGNDLSLEMHATAPLEGLQILRSLQLDPNQAVFAVEEKVSNINPLGRPYTIVQHPTLSAPFLNRGTLVNCSASIGLKQSLTGKVDVQSTEWPRANSKDGKPYSLENPKIVENSVYSFVSDPNNPLGWVTAYSPVHELLIGYLWKREDYPWIHLWQHGEGETMRYRGIEFGTAGIHKPFGEFIHSFPTLFGEKTFDFLDAGATVDRRYLAFLLDVGGQYKGVKNIELDGGNIVIHEKGAFTHLEIDTSFINFL